MCPILERTYNPPSCQARERGPPRCALRRWLIRGCAQSRCHPIFFQVLRDWTAVTMVRCFPAAQKASAVEKVTGYGFLYWPGTHQIQELSFAERPIAVFPLLVRVENFGCRSQLGNVHVFDATDSFREVLEVISLRESRKLRDIVQAHFNQTLHPGVFQPDKECWHRGQRALPNARQLVPRSTPTKAA